MIVDGRWMMLHSDTIICGGVVIQGKHKFNTVIEVKEGKK